MTVTQEAGGLEEVWVPPELKYSTKVVSVQSGTDIRSLNESPPEDSLSLEVEVLVKEHLRI